MRKGVLAGVLALGAGIGTWGLLNLKPAIIPRPSIGCAVGSFFAPKVYPQAPCYVPYARTSIWNTPLPAYPTPDPNSAAYVNFYVPRYGMFDNFQFGLTNETNDYGHPIYFAHASDPTYSVVCSASWASCSSVSLKFHLPAYAKPAGGSDHHLTIIDQTDNEEFDFWDVESISNGIVKAASAGHGPVTGSGLGFGQTAAGYAQWAGIIRQQELVAGIIPHALFVVAPCTSDADPVYPSNYRSTDTQCPGNNGFPYGERMRLTMPVAQIKALHIPSYEKAILVAFHDYGGYQADTNNGGSFSFQVEPDIMYSAAGYKNPNCPRNGAPCSPLTAYFHALGDPGWTGHSYNVDMSGSVDWGKYLQFLAPPIQEPDG